MGCGLNKLERREEKRPGNIYSTLKRPQVETKVDVAYEYRFLEFTTLSAGEYMPASFGFPGDPVLRPLCHVALSLSGWVERLWRTGEGGLPTRQLIDSRFAYETSHFLKDSN